MRSPLIHFALLVTCAAGACAQGIITTVAGTDLTYPSGSFPANNASFGQLSGVAVNPVTGEVYFASASRSLIIKFDPVKNTATVVAGIGIGGFSGDGGPAANAALNSPQGIAFDKAGSLYIADSSNNRIRRVDPQGRISTFAAGLRGPSGVTVASDSTLYVSDSNRISHLGADGTPTVIAGGLQSGYSGDGSPALQALLNRPQGLAFDSSGNLLIVDTFNYRIRRISPGGTITTVAGTAQFANAVNGPAAASPLSFLNWIAVDRSDNIFFGAGVLVRVSSNGTLSILSGRTQVATTPVPLSNARLSAIGLTFDPAGNLYLTDQFVSCLYRSSTAGTVQAVAGYSPNFGIGDNGPALSASLDGPLGIAVFSDGSVVIGDQFHNRIRKLAPSGTISTVVGTGLVGGPSSGPALSTNLLGQLELTTDFGGAFYATAAFSSLLQISSSGTVSVIAVGVSNTGPAAALGQPAGVALDAQGNLFIADLAGNRVWKRPPGGTLAAFAGTGQPGYSGDAGPALSATLNGPVAVATDYQGNVYIADTGNARIRRITPDGVITTIRINIFANGLVCDRQGNVFVAEGNRVGRIWIDGSYTIIAGTGSPGFGGDGGPATQALLNGPSGVALDGAGNLYISDTNNNRIRKVLAAPPTLSVSNAQVSISGVSQSFPIQAKVAVSSSVQGLGYSAAVATASGGDWLSIGSLQGTAPGVLTFTADPSALQPGTYQGSITITSPNASPNSLTVAVTFQVSAPQINKLSLETQAFSFSFSSGGSQSSQQFSVANQGSGPISFTALATTANGGGWLSVSPQSGSASDTAPAYVTVTAAPGSLGAGTYSGTVTVSSPDTKESITVGVTMSISAAQQKILLSQTGLTFIAVAQAGPPLPQSFGILNTGLGSMDWTASASTLSGGSGWLSIDQTSGTVARPYLDVSPVNVNINPAGLAAGNYYGQIQVKSAGAANSPQSISVVLNVLPAGSNPGPGIRPTGVIFIGTPGNNPGSQAVMVWSPSGDPQSYGSSATYVNGGNWLQYLPGNATVISGAPVKLIVQPDLTRLQPGIQRAAVTLLFADGSIRTLSVLNVVAPPGGAGINANGEAAASCSTLLVHPTSLTDTNASVTVGQAAPLAVKVADSCGNLLTSGTVTAGFTNGDAPVNLVHVGGGSWSGTWTPRGTSQSRVTIQYTALLGQGLQLSSGSASVPVTVQTGAPAPLTSLVANAASGLGTFVSPGGLVAIYGQQLADNAVTVGSSPLPIQVSGTQVLMGGHPLPLRYVGSGQVNAQVPFDLGINTQQQLVVMRGATISVPQDVVVAAAQPAVYTQDQRGIFGSRVGVIVNSTTNELITPSNPAKAGDVLELYANGLGAVNPAVPSGSPAPSQEPLARTVNPLTVTIGGLNAVVMYAGLAPGYPDLYQVNAVVPAGVAPGSSVPVILSIAGQSSPPVTMAVQ